MYQIIDFDSMKYANGDTGSKESAEHINEILQSYGLKKLGIMKIESEFDRPNPEFIKTSLFELLNIVANRIKIIKK